MLQSLITSKLLCSVKTNYGRLLRRNIIDTWTKRDQLDVTCFIISLFNAQHVSDVNTSILRSLRLICWIISWVVLLWFDVCCVTLWFDWGGVVSGCRLQPYLVAFVCIPTFIDYLFRACLIFWILYFDLFQVKVKFVSRWMMEYIIIGFMDCWV